MHQSLPFIIYPILGLAIGWATVGMKSQSGAAVTDASPAEPRARETREPPPVSGDEFFRAAQKKLETRRSQGNTDISELVAGWTDQEILAALNEALLDPASLLNPVSMAGLLFKEFVKRNPDKAADWIATLPAFQQKHFANRLVSIWPDERILDGLDYARKNRELFDGMIPVSLVNGCLNHVSGHGPEAITSLLEELAMDGFPRNHGYPVNFSPGFDYGALLSSERFKALQLTSLRSSIIQAWAATDRDATFQWIVDNASPGEAIHTFVPPWENSSDSARWLLKKVEVLDEAKQKDFLDSLRWQVSSSGFDARTWMGAAPPSMRDRLLLSTVQALYLPIQGRVQQVTKSLNILPDAEKRLQMLETLPAPTGLKVSNSPISEEEATALRRKLDEWGADPSRADAIIKRFNHPPKP